MFLKTTEYALRATLYIAKNASEERKLSLKEIAENIDSPVSFTAKILQILSKQENIIRGSRGVNGGYYIPLEAQKQPISRVIIAMGDEGVILNCVLGLSSCSDSKPCPMHHKYKVMKAQLFKMFEETTIESLVMDMNSQNLFLNTMKGME